MMPGLSPIVVAGALFQAAAAGRPNVLMMVVDDMRPLFGEVYETPGACPPQHHIPVRSNPPALLQASDGAPGMGAGTDAG